MRPMPEGPVPWDCGYDPDGNQVWGATEGGYVFRRINQGW